MLAAVAVAAVEAVMTVVGMLEVVTAVVALEAEVVCMHGRHAQLTAWVDRVADTGPAGERMAGRHEPSTIRNQSVKFP